MKKRKLLAAFMATTMLGASVFTGCGTTETTPEKDPAQTADKEPAKEDDKAPTKEEDKAPAERETLVVWSFTDEVKNLIENYYLKDFPDLPYDIETVVIPNEQYQSKIDPALQAGGDDAPDLFAIEAQYAKKYCDSDLTMGIDELGFTEEDLGVQLDYVSDVVRSTVDGKIKGISWQATPAAMFYRRSLAEEYLGTSEPAEVQEFFKDFDTLVQTAETIKAKSNGEVSILSSVGDLSQMYFSMREQGWVVDGKLIVDPQIVEYMEMAKVMQDNTYTADAAQWSEGWFAGMSGENIFAYGLPTWGLHFVLKPNAENAETGTSTAGDWGMIAGPTPYFWGGTWLTVRRGTEMTEEAAHLMEYLTLNEDFLERYATDSGDFLNNQNVVNKIKDDYSEPFLAGQNHYATFADMAGDVNASLLTGYDQTIQMLLDEQVIAYSKGEKDLETALNDFRQNVANAFPDLDVTE